MNEPLPQLDSDIARALAAERDRETFSPDDYRRMASTLGLALAGTKGLGIAAQLAGRLVRRAAMAWFAAGAVAGGVVGSVGYRTLVGPRVVIVEKPAPVQQQQEVKLPPAPPPAPLPERREAPVPKPKATRSDGDLAREQVLLDMARSALARDRAPDAIAALAQHAKDFPRGKLAEERESLWIQALARQGQRDEAARRADAFNRHYPDSVFRQSLEEVLHAAP